MAGDPTAYGARGRYQVRNRLGQFATGGSGIEWVGLELLDGMFAQYGDAMQAARVQAIDQLAVEIEDYMKANAPWNDRTTDARKGLKAIAVHDAVSSAVYAGYDPSTPYGFFLENYTYSGISYAIVRPTIERYAEVLGAMVVDAA
jgi:hypothetical protein